jgi:hypothetical protein
VSPHNGKVRNSRDQSRSWFEQQEHESYWENVAEAEHLRLKECAEKQGTQTAKTGTFEPVLLPAFSRTPASVDGRDDKNAREKEYQQSATWDAKLHDEL